MLGQKISNKLLFQFSCKGEKFSVDRLRLNLIELITIHINEENNETEEKFDITKVSKNPSCIVNKFIQHTWNDDGYDKLWTGKILSFNSNGQMYEVVNL